MKKLLFILLLPLGFAFAQETETIREYEESHSYNDKIVGAPTITSPEEEDEEPEAFTIVEKMPIFGNCDGNSDQYKCSQTNVLNFIENEVSKYKTNSQGKVYTRFIIDTTGNLIEENIVRGVNEELDNIALEIVKKMYAWSPGKQRGKAVRVQMTVVVNFK